MHLFFILISWVKTIESADSSPSVSVIFSKFRNSSFRGFCVEIVELMNTFQAQMHPYMRSPQLFLAKPKCKVHAAEEENDIAYKRCKDMLQVLSRAVSTEVTNRLLRVRGKGKIHFNQPYGTKRKRVTFAFRDR